MQDGVPFFVPRPGGDGGAFICLVEKAGSSAWKVLLGAIIRRSRPLRRAEVAARWRNASIPRVAIVRNPYSRLLSIYLDQVVGAHARPRFQRAYGRGNFTAFAQQMLRRARTEGHHRLNGHFQPVVYHCGLGPPGAPQRFDYALKIEQQALWYGPLVKVLGAAEEAAQPVGGRAGRRRAQCFYAPPGCTCLGEVVATSNVTRLTTSHETGADGLLARHVRAREADTITRFARADLERLAYPPFDGVDAAAYARLLSGLLPGDLSPEGAREYCSRWHATLSVQ